MKLICGANELIVGEGLAPPETSVMIPTKGRADDTLPYDRLVSFLSYIPDIINARHSRYVINAVPYNSFFHRLVVGGDFAYFYVKNFITHRFK